MQHFDQYKRLETFNARLFGKSGIASIFAIAEIAAEFANVALTRSAKPPMGRHFRQLEFYMELTAKNRSESDESEEFCEVSASRSRKPAVEPSLSRITV